MVVVKEKQFLVFYLDINIGDELCGRKVKYNLSNGETIGIKGGVVKKLNSQLGGMSIKEILSSIQDEKYRKFLNRVYDSTSGTWGWNYHNFGTLLEKSKKYKWMESFCSIGFHNFQHNLNLELKEIPKWLIKYCKGDLDGVEKTLKKGLLDSYLKNPDLFQAIFEFVKKESFDEFSWENVYNIYDTILILSNEYNYDYKSLLIYINNLMKYEGEPVLNNLITLILDEARMRKAMNTKVIDGVTKINKYDKYWKNIRTTHNITIRNYNRFKIAYDEIIFKEKIRMELEYKNKKYCIIYPKETQDMKDEAIMQSNCLASYITNVIDGKCNIVFMREVESPEKSLVTVEIRNNKIVQRLGKYNYEPLEEELEFLQEYDNKVLSKLRK